MIEDDQNTDISENFPPETFRGEVVSRGDVVTGRQPENSHNFDERPQNYDAFGREQALENASQIQIQDNPVPPQSALSDTPMAQVTNRRSSEDLRMTLSREHVIRNAGPIHGQRPINEAKVQGIPRTQASESALREETHPQFNTSLKPLIWLEQWMRLTRSLRAKQKQPGSPPNHTSRSRSR